MTGKKREVRKIFNSMDLEISRLKRTRFWTYFLPSKLKKGNYLTLSNKEVDAIKNYGT
jgi:16S rRNA uridine-516 pseudouridylate synthase and related pseudouridylate synthases